MRLSRSLRGKDKPVRDLRAGDLLIRHGDNRPVLVAEVLVSRRPKYGNTVEYRKVYRLLDGVSDTSRWIKDTEIAVKYRLPTP